MSISKLAEEGYRLDIRGWMCPYPKYIVDKLLRKMKPAKLIEVLVDCPSAMEDIPLTASKHGYETLSNYMIKDGEWKITLRRR